MVKARYSFFLILLVCLNNKAVHAHPHVFVDSNFILQVNNGTIQLHVTWLFDAVYSDLVANQYDENNNQISDPEELKNIQQNMLGKLDSYDYFTKVKLNHQAIKFLSSSKHQASFINNRLALNFTLTAAITEKIRTITAYSLDPEYYVHFSVDPRSTQQEWQIYDSFCFPKLDNFKEETNWLGEVSIQGLTCVL